ncbi:hypothetical protein lerEdw1_004987 [Lerista edwardsae]|nr:hypothetical protein lerEdw1_004987 [Lerista edwardsae]
MSAFKRARGFLEQPALQQERSVRTTGAAAEEESDGETPGGAPIPPPPPRSRGLTRLRAWSPPQFRFLKPNQAPKATPYLSSDCSWDCNWCRHCHLGVPAAVGALGFSAGGILAGSTAAQLMSATAVASGGGVAAGSTVAVLQSIGAAGLSVAAKVAITAGAAVLGAIFP